MEDQRKSRTPSEKHSDENLVELTKEMELSNQDDGEIIDLTHSVDKPDTPPAAATPAAPAPEQQTAPVPPVSSTEEETEPIGAIEDDKDSPSEIEEQVDAAFDVVQSNQDEDPSETAPDETLFDDLTDMTERVDEAVLQHAAQESLEPEITDLSGEEALEPSLETSSEIPPETPPEISDDEAIAADAAVFEAAMSDGQMATSENEVSTEAPGTSEAAEDEEIIELTDIVAPEEYAEATATAVQDDDEDIDDEDILELTDIVDPAQMAAELEDDQEVLELTDIVEFNEEEIDVSIEDAATDEIEPATVAEAPASTQDVEMEDPSVDTAELADLFMDEMLPGEPAAEEISSLDPEPVADDHLAAVDDISEEDEQVIQLSDVLGHTDAEDRIPIEKIKMGAEEDLAAQPVSLEQEDTANALGLNLEMQQKIEAAVEHLLETKYSGTIQRLIADAVNKAVAVRMDEIQRSTPDGKDADT